MVKIYKVGGCVRDKLLGIQSQDIDYVVVGATLDYMQQQGFIPVGQHFPVFIDPKTHAQYALARTERKVGVGYHGFKFYTATDVTLEQDLKRRDITINAIAEDENGQLIDPFNGVYDLTHRIIRHISPIFAEDPLRVLRVARFRAKLGFNIALETLELMRQICKSNELEYLSGERIWDEVRKSLGCPSPIEFFQVLNQVGALEHILSEFKLLAENNILNKQITESLIKANHLTYTSEEKFGIIIYHITKNHPYIATHIIKNCKLGRSYTELGSLISKNLGSLLNFEALEAQAVLQIIRNMDPIRRPQRFEQIYKIISITSIANEKKCLDFVKETANRFKQIKYKQFANRNSLTFIQAINQIKITIISDLYKQFFGA